MKIKSRALLTLGLALVAVSAWLVRFERSASQIARAYDRDSAALSALPAAHAALCTSVLEARAGLDWNYDAINCAVLSLRGAQEEATILREHGTRYAATAEALMQASIALRSEETALEMFKTDLALLRLSARYFPLAADALMRRSGASDAFTQAIGALRTQVERYEETPTREIAQELEVAIPKLEAMHASLSDSAQSDLDVLLGHTRVMIDRRERLDRFTRALVHSPVRAHLLGARNAFEQAAREQYAWVLGWRIAAIQLAVLSLLTLWAAAHSGRRTPHLRTQATELGSGLR